MKHNLNRVYSNVFRIFFVNYFYMFVLIVDHWDVKATFHDLYRDIVITEIYLSYYFLLTMAIKNKIKIARVIPKKMMSVYGVSKASTASSR
jgi:hypothetical protein